MDALKDNYSSSSDNDTESESSVDVRESSGTATEKLLLPRVPSEIAGKYHIEPSVSKYAMKMHLLGRWTSFLYLEWKPSTAERYDLARYISQYNRWLAREFSGQRIVFEPLFHTELGSPRLLHVSLSPNLYFNDDKERDRFFETLRESVNRSNTVKPFHLKFDTQPAVLFSKQQDAAFLALKVSKESLPALNSLSSVIEEALKGVSPSGNTYGNFFAKFSKTAHMSIAKTKRSILQDPEITAGPPYEYSPITTFSADSFNLDKNRSYITIKLPHR
ncbi:phosphoric diester hydrolase KNAG_0G02480 [Huiozyma naganishii CBS 8797]|uniref:U6 snRNA phosphodiesterase 1 n=1 Tax=Huiozyma naganishii (strain ATCC MYA-139 / BCRC 22969 / CBS 8797 / KCTC 17520 / NBRC 10181 / NCYC 3082 / Yp74L-3) TaxID=1071383 RepID=J7R8V5_HUIN7|nr:hypothetical protein KNAG_0G02480 [Kazachstania naganishii CBS 8797]CCK71305.1 hypothetical protein KNAG_0G02480 [Kazachstania naganishii CBS 8797]